MIRNSLNDLKRTLEDIRQEKHPEIPAEVIERIVEVQANNQDNATKRQAETEKIIDEYIKSSTRGEAK